MNLTASRIAARNPLKRKRAKVAPRPQKKLTAADKRTDAGRFAVHLTALMAERGWDHNKLAERLGCTDAAVRRWLRAEVMPRYIEDFKALGRALDVPEHPFPDYRLVLPPPR